MDDVSRINFDLPPLLEDSQNFLRSLPSPTAPQIFIGNPTWGSKKWLGKIYPSKSQPKDFFSHYVQQYSTIELNTTFYQIPEKDTIERWKNTASLRQESKFKFCPKIFRGVSHHPRFGLDHTSAPLIEECIHVFSSFEDALGLCFLQIPSEASLQTHGTALKNFIERLPTGFPLALEFRHPSWFDGASLRPKLVDYLRKRKISPVITDVAGRRDVLHQSITSDSLMIRFIGNDLHPSDYQRIDTWVERLKELISLGLRYIYFMAHEPEDTYAPELASYLISKINSSGLSVSHAPIRFTESKSLPLQKALF